MNRLIVFFKPEKRRIAVLLFSLFALFLTLALLSEGSYGGADDIVHYRFAHFAFQYPYLLLDHWAKPIFTILASPFAQFGYWGVKCFNIVLGCFTGFILWRISLILKINRGWMTIPILFFMPVYTSMLLSGMTEILFSTILALAAFLFLRKNYIWAAVVISFLPIARTEGIVIWPVFAFAILWHRQWKAIPFMLTGSLMYSLIGGPYYHDFLWLIHRMPYSDTYDIYGHGELLHFVKSTKLIFGIPSALLFILGLLSGIHKKINLFIPQIKINKYLPLSQLPAIGFDEFFIVLCPLLIYYTAHSYVWWKGISSLGLIRVMAGIAPLFVIFSLRGINFLIDLAPLRSLLQKMATFILLFFIVLTPFQVLNLPVNLSETDLVIKKAAIWYAHSTYKHHKFYVGDPYFYFYQDVDPYNPAIMSDGIPNWQHPDKDVKPGEIIVWESHFFGHDSQFPLERILNNPYYLPVKTFFRRDYNKSDPDAYFMCLFERLPSARKQNNQRILDSLILVDTPKFRKINLISDDFESYSSKDIPDLRNRQRHVSGQYSLLITPQYAFYNVLDRETKHLHLQEGDQIEVSFSFLQEVRNKPILLAVSMQKGNQIYYYQTFELKRDSIAKWKNYQIRAKLQTPASLNDKLSVYFWNLNKDSIYLDDITVNLLKQCN